MESSIGTLCTVKVYNRQVMKYYVRTYGCQMNVADSNEMGRHFKSKGLVETENPDEASIFLVNTCTVRQHAEDRDRKSTRLNSSHTVISYAVFCLKKKK